MSDSVEPTMTSDQPLSDRSDQPQSSPNPEVAEPAQATAAAESDWQTVDFPGAISVDSIPHEAPAAIAQPPSSTEVALQAENAELRHHLVQLQEDLSQAQVELQLEVARSYSKESEMQALNEQRAQQAAELTAAQAQLQQLAQELEHAEETSRRQEVLVETLTRQLENSQERIAQLERDCALSQQRYNEQVQLVSQVENTCRDLRMRLHRQQQQTLQFKAALEKSIETTAIAHSEGLEPKAIAEVEPDHQAQAAQDFIPKAQPVRPWSTAPGGAGTRFYAIARHHSASLPNLLSKLFKPEAAANAQPGGTNPTEAASQPKAALPDLSSYGNQPPESIAAAPASLPETPQAPPQEAIHHIFPAFEITPRPIADPLPPESVFDLTPFIEAGEVASTNGTPSSSEAPRSPELSAPSTPAPTPKPNEAVRESDTLWADLARLIEPDLVAAETEAAEAATSTTPPSPAPAPLTPLQQPAIAAEAGNSNPATAAEESPVSWPHQGAQQPISLVSFSRQKEAAGDRAANTPAPVAHNPFPSFTLSEPASTAQPELPEDTQQPAAADPSEAWAVTSGSWPSPVVYPFRQPKKIPSMAAVDLPSFPRG